MALKYDPRSGDFRDFPDNPVITSFTCNGGSTCYTNEDISLKWEIEDIQHLYLNGEEINADYPRLSKRCLSICAYARLFKTMDGR